MVGPHAVEVVLAFAARLDQPGDPEQGQMMAHRGLALAQPLAQVGDVKLAVGRQGEIEQDAQARLIAQELEDLSKFANGLIRHFRGRRGGLAVCAR